MVAVFLHLITMVAVYGGGIPTSYNYGSVYGGGVPTSYNYGGKLLSNMLGSCLGSNEFAIA